MMGFMATALISLIEKELLKAEPELEALVIAQLEKLGGVIMAYVQTKLSGVAAPVALADSSADAVPLSK